jgi:glucose dehydrogenase
MTTLCIILLYAAGVCAFFAWAMWTAGLDQWKDFS